jgi:peptide/nickel transport system substrate-binding protein
MARVCGEVAARGAASVERLEGGSQTVDDRHAGFTGEPELSRRSLLKGAGAAGLWLATGSAALGAGAGAAAAASKAANTGTPPNPKHGGNLRVGIAGNGTSETYNPFIVSTPIDTLHTSCVFDPMIRPAPFYGTEPGLITAWNSNKDATVWELKLRQGVTWHDGKPFTPEDVMYTLRQMAGPNSLASYAVSNVRLNDLKKLDAHTLRVPLSRPIAYLPGYFIYTNEAFVVQNGTKNYSKPVGTGPFKLQSFVPGQRSVLAANRHYWDSPKPYPDQLEVISIDDPTARINALMGGQIDLCLNYPFAEAAANLKSSQIKVVVGEPGVSYVFYMRCDAGPFKDVRVRQAMRLIIDRPAMIEAAMSGFAGVGNDLLCPGVKYFDKSIPQRTQDVAKAKSLLKAAGASNLRVTLNTAEVLPGFTAAATVFAQQAAAAGVQIKVNRQQPAQYFNPQIFYLKESFAQDAWPGPSLVNNYSQQYLKDSVYNETHFRSDSYDNLFFKAEAETNPQKAQQLWNQVQQIQWQQGGHIVWAYWKSTDAASPNVRGFGEPGSGWLYGTDDDRVWNWGLA